MRLYRPPYAGREIQMSLIRFNVEDRAQFYSRGAVGTILRVINGGMAYLFLADSGAKFTARADELAPIGSPDRVAPSSSDARTVFVFQHPHGAKQRTPSQQQQANAGRKASDV